MIINVSWLQSCYDQRGYHVVPANIPTLILGLNRLAGGELVCQIPENAGEGSPVRQANAVAHTSIQPFKVTMIEQVFDIGVGRAAG